MEILERHKSKINSLCEKHNVNRLYAFGSVVSDHFNENSDIDLLVAFNDIELLEYAGNFFDLLYSMEDLLQRPVDLVPEKSLTNPYFIKSVNENKKLIYG